MSSTGVRKKRTPFDIAIESLRDTNSADIERMKMFSAESSPISGNVGASSTNSATPGGSFLNIAGQTPMLGAIAFNPVLVIIDSNGRIDLTPSADPPTNYSTYVLMTGAGTPDNLNFVDGAANDGQLLYLQGTISQVLTIKHAESGTISNIVGTTTVTVTTTVIHGLTTGELVDISGTTNFNIQNASITVTSTTTFTYAATGSATPETSGSFQNGNILTSDGSDVILDGTTATEAVPWIALLFDPTGGIGGAWRVQFSGGEFFGPWTADHDAGGFDLIDSGSIIPIIDNTHSLGSSSESFASGFIRKLVFNGTVARSSGDDNFFIHRDTDGVTFQLGLEGASEFGKWRWADKDNVDRVVWDINSTGKNFQYNFATGGWKLRRNDSDVEALLMFPRGNSFSANDMIINANFAFSAGQGLLLQRNGTNKMRIAEDIFMFDDVNMGGNLLLNVGNITTASGASEIGTSVVGFDTIHVENVTFDGDTGIALGTFGISIFANDTGDDVFLRADDTVFVQSNSSGSLGFFGTTTSNTKQTITGSRGGNAALADLLTKLALYNIIVDSTT